MESQVFTKYRSLLEECRQAVNRIDFKADESYLVRFAIFSANLTKFLPSIPLSSHEKIFQDSICNSSFENFDWNVLEISSITKVIDPQKVLDRPKQPFIFCSFHLGSYRVITHHLYHKGIDFSILVRGQVYEKQAADLLELAQRVNEKYNINTDVRIHNAENPDILLKVLRELKEGRSLLIYVDGNTGTGDDAEKMNTISFLNNQIQLRKGIGFMSYLSGVPILPVVSYRDKNLRNVLVFKGLIQPDKTHSREEFSQRVNQKIYDLFSQYLLKYPSQWEGWNYVHKFLAPQSLNATETATIDYKNIKRTYEFNVSRYSLINLQNMSILFDRKHYTTFEISHDLNNYLSSKVYPNPQKVLGRSIFSQLVQQSVII